jgi:hypothetical protein
MYKRKEMKSETGEAMPSVVVAATAHVTTYKSSMPVALRTRMIGCSSREKDNGFQDIGLTVPKRPNPRIKANESSSVMNDTCPVPSTRNRILQL